MERNYGMLSERLREELKWMTEMEMESFAPRNSACGKPILGEVSPEIKSVYALLEKYLEKSICGDLEPEADTEILLNISSLHEHKNRLLYEQFGCHVSVVAGWRAVQSRIETELFPEFMLLRFAI